MREEINRLMTLQGLDQKLSEQEAVLAKLRERVDEINQVVEQADAELKRLQSEDQQMTLARKELELALTEGETQIRNKRMRLSAVRNEKELQSLTYEVEALKENNQRLEADALARMETAEQRAVQMKELDELIESKRNELREAEKEVASELEEAKSAMVRQRIERDKLATQIDKLMLGRYETIFAHRKGTAIVGAREETCQGCRMRIPPQLYNEIQRSSDIHFCPNCQRIIYYEAESQG